MPSTTPWLYQITSGAETGAFNMAMDDRLLEKLRTNTNASDQPILIVRTYQWSVPTLSYGVNQSEKEVLKLLNRYGYGSHNLKAWVRRPTGGRAILHGEDISFSFITNCPEICRLSLKESYAFLMGFVREAFNTLGVDLNDASASQREYTLSPVCFETKTPSDLLDQQGQKVAGCSQLRRKGGILQHGSAFIRPYKISPTMFTQALLKAVANEYGYETLPEFKMEAEEEALFLKPFDQRLKELCNEASEILEKASTTTGSHFVPASS